MNIEWKKVELPDFDVQDEMPEIPKSVYETRCEKLYDASNSEWVVVYGDREHFANLHYFTEFDPRWEEALLILGPNNSKYMLIGNEGLIYESVIKPEVEIVLCQTFSLMGQDRTKSKKLEDILIDIGLAQGDRVGICGWKYVETNEVGNHQAYFVPTFIIDCIQSIIGGNEGLTDVTKKIMHPITGLRAHNEVEQLAVFEWGAARASKALWNIVKGTKPGISEFEAVSHMGYAGEPLTMFMNYATGKDAIVGLRSPSGKQIEEGDGVFTALGYRGGLSCRAGLVEAENEEFLTKWAFPYYKGIVAWYETAAVGIKGGEVHKRVTEVMEEGGLRPLLNPGHSSGTDEWLHTFFTPGNEEVIASGMAIQCDIIPTPLADGIQLNSEDMVVFADENLRKAIKEKYPDMWKRIEARQNFMRESLGINISDDILPFSTTPGYYAPLFLSPDHVLTVK